MVCLTNSPCKPCLACTTGLACKRGALPSAGPVMASSNEFRIVIRGKGGHAALPHNSVDPGAHCLPDGAGVSDHHQPQQKPIDAGVLSVTMIHAGEATNVVPDYCELQGTVRTFTLEVLDMVEARMRQIAQHTCAAHDAVCEFEFHRNYPPTINSGRGRVCASGHGGHCGR